MYYEGGRVGHLTFPIEVRSKFYVIKPHVSVYDMIMTRVEIILLHAELADDFTLV